MALTAFKRAQKGLIFDIRSDTGGLIMTSEDLALHAVQHGIGDISNQPMVAFDHGFVDPLNITKAASPDTDSVWVGRCACAYRFDRRTIPSDVMEAAVARATAEKLFENNSIPLSKHDKAQIVEQVKMRLLPTTPVKHKTVLLTLDEQYGFLAVWGGSDKEVDIITSVLARKFEGLPVTPLDAIGLAQLLRKDDYDTKREKLEEIIAKQTSAPQECQATADMATWLWFLSETTQPVDGHDSLFVSPLCSFNLSVDGNTLQVGELDGEGNACDVLTSKEADHGHIRYALWKDGKSAIAAKFTMDNSSIGSTKFALDATKPWVTAVDIAKIFDLKALTCQKKIPAKFCSAKLTEDMELRADYDKFLSNVLDNQERAIVEAIGCMHMTVMNLATVADLYVTARISPKRWEGTWDKVQEWLLAYVPECERIKQPASGA